MIIAEHVITWSHERNFMIKPMGGLVLIKQEALAETTTASGLVLSASYKDNGPKKGTVIAIGTGEPNALNGEIIHIPDFQPDDIVLYPDHSGHEVEDEDGTKYLLVHYKHILGKVVA